MEGTHQAFRIDTCMSWFVFHAFLGDLGAQVKPQTPQTLKPSFKSKVDWDKTWCGTEKLNRTEGLLQEAYTAAFSASTLLTLQSPSLEGRKPKRISSLGFTAAQVVRPCLGQNRESAKSAWWQAIPDLPSLDWQTRSFLPDLASFLQPSLHNSYKNHQSCVLKFLMSHPAMLVSMLGTSSHFASSDATFANPVTWMARVRRDWLAGMFSLLPALG